MYHPPTGIIPGSNTDRLQIVYIILVMPFMLAAFVEWFLWLAAFLFCLVKVFQKAEHWSTRFLAVIMMIVFTALRYGRTMLTDNPLCG